MREAKNRKPSNERDATPITYDEAKQYALLVKEKPLSRKSWWFAGPGLVGCVLMAKPKAGTSINSPSSTLAGLQAGDATVDVKIIMDPQVETSKSTQDAQCEISSLNAISCNQESTPDEETVSNFKCEAANIPNEEACPAKASDSEAITQDDGPAQISSDVSPKSDSKGCCCLSVLCNSKDRGASFSTATTDTDTMASHDLPDTAVSTNGAASVTSISIARKTHEIVGDGPADESAENEDPQHPRRNPAAKLAGPILPPRVGSKPTPSTNDQVPLPPSSARLPRGLIIFSTCQNDIHKFHKGFDYPGSILIAYKITKKDWFGFCNALAAPVIRHKKDLYPGIGANMFPGVYEDRIVNKEYLHVRRVIDDILDIASLWDRTFFRPKGLILRLDMPGEAKFGLTFMDFWHEGHIDNCSGVLSQKVRNYEDSSHHSLDKTDLHLVGVLERGYCSTRVVLDELVVLENKKLSNERGWTEWDRIFAHAHSIPPLATDDPARIELGKAFDDRWPHAKHIFYERYRGEANAVRKGGPRSRFIWIWHPSHDSLDQRNGEDMLADRAVLPADNLNLEGIERDIPVYWENWAISLLKVDGYYGEQGKNQTKSFIKRAPSKIQG
jgi:hypothetical protein